jgi:hypothetical protein
MKTKQSYTNDMIIRMIDEWFKAGHELVSIKDYKLIKTYAWMMINKQFPKKVKKK